MLVKRVLTFRLDNKAGMALSWNITHLTELDAITNVNENICMKHSSVSVVQYLFATKPAQ